MNLTDEQIVEIRHRYHDERTLSHMALAAEYRTSRMTISRICRHLIRSELGGPLTKARHYTYAKFAPIIGPAEVAFSIEAAAGYLGVANSSVRDYIMRGRLVRDSPGLISLDSLLLYEQQYKRFALPRFKPPPLPTRCTRCGLLEFDEDGLCDFCRAEMRTGKFVLYSLGFDEFDKVL